MSRFALFFKRFIAWFQRLPSRVRRTLYIILSVFFVFLLLDILFPVNTFINYSRLVLDKDGALINASLSADQQWVMKAELDELNPLLLKTIIEKEDKWFWVHPGVNPMAMGRALWQNLIHNRRMSGASTITMQVIRMLEPRDRTIYSKFIECIRAFQLEMHCSKKQILQLYINLLPYGGNIKGVKAACYLYLNQAPQTLSAAQIVTLALIPNNPNMFRPGNGNEAILKERNIWLSRLFKKKVFSSVEFSNAIQEPLTAIRTDAPRKVPHLSRFLASAFPDKVIIKTYINQQYQDFVENAVRNEVNMYRGMGVGNAAVVVIDNHSHAVIAYVGSAGFMDNAFQGQVDGARALRSPGSTLKPFLYAQAMDKGLITPKTMLEDVPKNYNGYRPLNYDETFRGRLPAAQALALSLNIPAVELENKMGVDVFNEKLSRGGLLWVSERRKSLGLSVILGGCGVTLLEMTRLYHSLSQNGLFYKINFTTNGISSKPDTLFSPESSFLVTEILTSLKRPDLPNNFDNSVNMPHIAWKTGTSYGRRDAWAIGYNKDYTIGVWVGNFDGTGVPELSGAEFATPILFKVFNFLSYKKQPSWFKRPHGLDFRLVCSESGLPPGENCTSIVMDDFIPAVSPNRKCDHQIPVFVDALASLSYCRNCLPEVGYKTEWYPNLSPSVIAFYEDEQIPYRKIPPHNPSCTRVYHDDQPVITSLSDGKEYILFEGAEQQLQLTFSATSDVSKVYWYLNDRFYKEAISGQKHFFTPTPGLTKISCSDDKGRNTNIFITVKVLPK